jgi:hypothetical protein
MLYVCQLNRQLGKYGVCDTDDGAIDFVTQEELLHIVHNLKIPVKGVKGNTIQVVSVTNQIMDSEFGQIKTMVSKLVDGWSEETCLEFARGAHFVKQIKGLPIAEMRKVVVDNVYPKSIQEAVMDAQKYTNQVHEVNPKDKNAIINALKNNVCLVLQHKTNGVLTSFVCTGSFAVEDAIYEPGFFDAVYLTKQLYNYTYNIEKVRPAKTESDKPKNPNLLNVMSCSLRFRNDGVHHDKGNMILSSPFYTVNLERVFKIFILDNPSQLGNTILGEFHRSSHLGTYDFDFDLYQDVLRCCEDGTNYFGNEGYFLRYVNTQNLQSGVELSSILARFQSDFDYLEYLRGQGYSFNYRG